MAFIPQQRERRERPDTLAFVELINSLDRQRSPFSDDVPIRIARAPGRLDVMGGIADYSGSLVLELPTEEATFAAVQRADDGKIRIVSRFSQDKGYAEHAVSTDLTLTPEGRSEFRKEARGKWFAYIAGVFFILAEQLDADISSGARVFINSSLPIGKGVSSSAALEVSTMAAVCSAFDIPIDARQLAMLCQRVENTIVGAPCGVMDQIASSCGSGNALLRMICQPAELLDPLPIPDGMKFRGIDSGVRHAVSGSDYGSIRAAAFMGHRIIADLRGLRAEPVADGVVRIDGDPTDGYLSNISPDEYESEFAAAIPDTISGNDFLSKYAGSIDTATRIEKTAVYPVRAAAEHAIYDSERVRRFAAELAGMKGPDSIKKLGELMYGSHESYRRCGLTEEGTELLVKLGREYKDRGICGARITGGGSGGTVVFLTASDGEEAIEEIAEKYKKAAGKKPYIFSRSSPGCAEYGIVTLKPQA